MIQGSHAISIHHLGASDVARWDAFVDRSPDATFFHLAGWKEVIERAFGHSTYFLYAESGGEICGLLPLARIRSLLFGSGLISLPFCVYGGSIGVSLEVCERLDSAACDLAEKLNVDHLELRYRTQRHQEWPNKEIYSTFRKGIDADPERNMLAIPRKQRAMVRKGIEIGLKSRVDHDVATVHRLYSESVRNLGTPVFSKDYFFILKDVFGDQCELLTVHHGRQVVAGVLNFVFRDEILPYYGGGGGAARKLKANDFMYWEVMRRACERGIRQFDFGRSKYGTGSFDFKQNWGFEPQPMSYEYHLVNAASLPDINPLNPKYRIFIEGWKRLPLPLSRMLGPFISRNLG